ncbi:MAG: hypothetical protein Q9164_002559 [Protoblastenia rupestris]
MAEYSKYSEVSPQWIEFLSQYPELGNLDSVGVVERRRIFDELETDDSARKLPEDVNEDSFAVRTFTIKARDGYEIPVRSYIPESSHTTKSRPLLVYLHAGGFLFGDLESGDLNCRVLATRLNISVLNVGYRLAPKWPFPHGLNDSYDATEWAAANAEQHLSASPATGFLVGGISSGANFAGVIAYTARDAGLSPPITGLFVSVPVCLMPQAYHLVPPELKDQLLSLEQNADNPMLTRKSLTDIQDPLRDEAFLWQKLLQKHSGTKTKIHLYSGMPHGFWRFLQLKASQEWLDDLVEGIGFLCASEDEVKQTNLIIKGIQSLKQPDRDDT